jgi:SAM-dependent methyltransferase
MDNDRAARDKAAYDEGDFQSLRKRIQGLYRYVYGSPNSLRAKAYWQGTVRDALKGRRVLEIGCGEGWDCRRFLEWGAAEVHGIDVSTAMLAVAKQHESAHLKFFEHDLHQPWPYQYDVIVGRSVLHHLDYQPILTTLYDRNLAPGGQMVFVEPLGQGLLMRVYWALGRRLHTPDERPFRKADVQWMRGRFSGFKLFPMNLTSLPAAVASWVLRLGPDNVLTRLADRFDVFVADRIEPLKLHYRSAVFHISKPSSGSDAPPVQAASA